MTTLVNTSLEDKLKEIISYKLLQIHDMLSYVPTYKVSRDYLYFGWKLQNGHIKIYDLIENEDFIINAKNLKIKVISNKKEITFSRL